MRRFGGLFAIAAMALAMPMAVAMPASQPAVGVTIPKKLRKAVKRHKHAEPQGRWPRSRNKPPKRKLHRNLITHSRRVRRKHRRARAA